MKLNYQENTERGPSLELKWRDCQWESVEEREEAAADTHAAFSDWVDFSGDPKLYASTAWGAGLISGRRIKIVHK